MHTKNAPSHISSCEETTSNSQCYSVFWVTKDITGLEDWDFLYAYCAGDECDGGGTGGGGGEDDPPVAISSFTGFPKNPIDGQVAVFINKDGVRTEFTYDAGLNTWLLPEVQLLKETGYNITVNIPVTGEDFIMTAIPLTIGLPTLGGAGAAAIFGEAALVIGGVVITAVFVYKFAEWAARQATNRAECLSYYLPCVNGFEYIYDCAMCLQYCLTQGEWNFYLCGAVIPIPVEI